jgi:hypothetical protein
MKRYIQITLSAVLCILFTNSYSQKSFTSAQQKIIESKVDSVLDLYREYAGFTKDIDEDQLTEEYIQGFLNLFSSGKTVIINDLDYTKATPPRITVDQYIEYVRDWYPGGLSIGVKTLKKDAPSFSDNKYHVVVRANKELKGLYKNQNLQIFKGEMRFVLDFNDRLSDFKISQIDDNKGSDSCNINKKTANDLLASNDFKKAKNYFLKALHWCPGDPECQAGILKAEEGIAQNLKPLYFTIHLMPGYSLLNVTPDKSLGVNFTSSSGLNYGGGLGVELAVLKNKTGMLSVGLRLEYAMYNSTIEADSISDAVKGLVDPDNDNYTLLYKVTSLSEKDQISYFQVPVFVKYDLSLSKSFAIYFKLGAKAQLAVSKNYKTTGTGVFKGMLTDSIYNNTIIYGNEISKNGVDYGFGTYALDVSKSNENLNSLFFSANAGVGFTLDLSKSIGIFFGADYTMGLSDIAKSGGKNFSLSRGRDKIYSLYGYSTASLSNLQAEVGLKFRIMEY